MKNKLLALAITAASSLIPGLTLACYNLDETASTEGYSYPFFDPARKSHNKPGKICITLESLQPDHLYNIACPLSREVNPSSIKAGLSYGNATFSYQNTMLIFQDVHVNHKAHHYDSIEIENYDRQDFSLSCYATDSLEVANDSQEPR